MSPTGRVKGREDGEKGSTGAPTTGGEEASAPINAPQACPVVDLPDGDRGDEVMTVGATGVSCAEAEEVGRAFATTEEAQALGYSLARCTKGSARVKFGFFAR